ncbi:catalase [Fusarium sp. NRRL 25303]|nr:catalase [Fusarium sp. NRRL 25303]
MQASCSSTITEHPKDGASTTAMDAKPSALTPTKSLSKHDQKQFTGYLWGTVEKGEEIEWTAHVKVMDPKLADPDKLWLVLHKNPGNYHRNVEQAAFSPGSMFPGIEDSPDPLLQFRMFFYRDAQYRRIGVNLHPTASLTSSNLMSLRRRIRSATTLQAGLVTIGMKLRRKTTVKRTKGLRCIKFPEIKSKYLAQV